MGSDIGFMKWLAKLLSCGRLDREMKQHVESGGELHCLASEPTRLGESPGESAFVAPANARETSDTMTVTIRKNAGERLGLKLFFHSVQIQAIEEDSVMSQYSCDIPIGSSICLVNGKSATVPNVKSLLRECLYLREVQIVISRSGDCTQCPGYTSYRKSHSSGGASLSPTPSQLSSMWRRVSETGSVAVPETPVVPIDFDKLSRDSMSMWTRRNGSLPDPLRDSFEAECAESPPAWLARRRAKRSSCLADFSHSEQPN